MFGSSASTSERRRRVEEALETVGLADRATHLPPGDCPEGSVSEWPSHEASSTIRCSFSPTSLPAISTVPMPPRFWTSCSIYSARGSDPGYGVSRAGSGPALQAANQDEGRKRHQPAVGAGRRRGDMNHLQLAFRNLQTPAPRSILTVLGVARCRRQLHHALWPVAQRATRMCSRAFEERGTDLTVRRRGVAEPFGGTMPNRLSRTSPKFPVSPA